MHSEDLKLALSPAATRLQLKNQHKMTLLHEAVIRNSLIAVWKLINEMKRPSNNQLPVVDRNNRKQQIRTYRRAPCDKESKLYTTLNMKNKDGWTPLHYAADHGFVDVLQVLLMVEECDVTIYNHARQTAFHLAVRKGHLTCLELLFVAAQCSQSLDSLLKIDKKGWNLACHACAQDDIKVMEWLLRNMPQHADVCHFTKKGFTPLLTACYYQKVEILRFLLEHDQVSEIAAVTVDCKTGLHLAAMHDSVEVAQLLLNKDFPMDEHDENGETALHVAYKKGSHQVWRLLLNEGADRNKENKNGKCPKDLKYHDLKVPAEVEKRGETAIQGYIAALRKGKKKMPRCKLMIVGEAGVGKTNLLNLLTGEEFVAKHEKTEGVDIDLVSTNDIITETWKKSMIETNEEYRNVAVNVMADQLHKFVPPNSKKKDASITDGSNYRSLQEQIDELIQKYTRKPGKSGYKHASSHSTKLSSEKKKNVVAVAFLPESQPVQPSAPPVAVPRITPPQAMDKIHFEVTDQLPQGTVPVVVPSQQSSSVVSTPPPHAAPDISSSDHTNISDISIIREASKKSKQAKSAQSVLPLKLTSFDFAGQKHYKPMHHCFITSRAIYVVAFNARQLLYGDQTVVIQELKFWINSIRVHTNAVVVLVGTHKGPYDGASGDDLTKEEKRPFLQLSEQDMEDINNLLKRHFDKDHCNLELFKNEKIMALVENSIRNESRSGANIVRKTLKQLGDDHPGNKDDLPISYLHLEAMITEKRNNNGPLLITHEEIEQCAKECGIDECQVSLDFFHDIGIIIDPRNLPTLFLSKEQMEPLHDVVLIKPQWLADVMKELMNIDRGDDKLKPKEDDMKKALRKFKNEGKADKKHVLFPLWREYHNGSEEMFQQICLLLEAYGLIVPVQQSQYYYVPCKLPKDVENIIPNVTKNCHKLCVSFKDGFYPPFLLHHLMFLMYRRIQDIDDDDDNCFFDEKCYIECVADCQWWLSQSVPSNSIDVAIRTKQQIRSILPAMELLHTLILRIVEKKELKGIKYKLGPIVECSQCEEECLFTYITYNSGGDPTSKRNNYLQCNECRSKVTISPSIEMIISKTYSYNKPLGDFKDDLQFDELDAELRGHFIESFRKDIPNGDTLSCDTKVLKDWYECKQKDPWPLIVKYLSNYEHKKDADNIINKLKHKFIYMCEL
ncbi:uncharacterized protein [Dysidea avara]